MVWRMRMTNFNIRDVIAIVMIVGLIIMKCLGFDGTATALLALIGGYYFGRRDIELSKSK